MEMPSLGGIERRSVMIPKGDLLTGASLRRLGFMVVVCGIGVLSGCADSGPREVEIRFQAVLDGQPAQCDTRYSGVGVTGASAEIGDARFFISNIRGVSRDGADIPLELDQTSPWQFQNVALLDFEDGTGRCSEVGTAQTNTIVRGVLASGPIVGLRFDLGIPHELNHGDVTLAESPLNLNALFWNWRFGYIFTKVDLWLPEVEQDLSAEPSLEYGPNLAFLLHIGSTGCGPGEPTSPPDEPCDHRNIVSVELSDFDVDRDAVVLDLSAFVAQIDVTQSVPRPPGCMSGRSDPDCEEVFSALGLSLESGACMDGCADQRLVRVGRGAARGDDR